MRIIEIGSGKKPLQLVAGLVWHPLEKIGSAQSKEILAYAKAGNDDLKILRDGSTPHVGLGKQSDGGKSGQLAIAARVADVLLAEGCRNCLVALQHPTDQSLFLFTSTRDNVILADGDVVGTRDEIRVRLVGDVAYGGWDVVICPDEWGVLNSTERDLGSFLAPEHLGNGKAWRISDISLPWRKAVLPVGIFVIVAIATSVGWHFWQIKQQQAAELLRIQQEEVLLGQKLAPTAPPKPWPLMPHASQFAQACTQAYRRANLIAGNWALDSVICENGALTIKWNKANKSAWISHLRMARPDAIISADTMIATVVTPIATTPANDFDSQLPIVSGITSHYQDLASRFNFTIGINQIIEPVPITLPGQTATSSMESTASWQVMQLTIATNLDPITLIGIIDYPGLRLKRIDFEKKSGVQHFKLTGEQYVLF